MRRGVEVILMGGLNVQLQEPRDKREEDIVTTLADRMMVGMTAHFNPLMRYIGGVQWTWLTQKEGRQVTGGGICPQN